jgi:hypothetical protein
MVEDIILNGNIVVEMPVNIYKVTELRIEESFNNHAKAYIAGILDEKERIKAIYDLNIKTNVKIKAVTEKEEKVLFSGVPVNADIKHINGVYYICIFLNSYSIYLDILLKSRSFQNAKNAYINIFNGIMKEYNGLVLDAAAKGAVQNAPIIQYEETDWEFLKRIASQLGTKIYPSVICREPEINIGIKSGNCCEEENHNYTIEKNIKDYLDFKENYRSCHEEDFITYGVESKTGYGLGDTVRYKGFDFLVVQKVSELKKGIFIHRYLLQKESGVKQNTIYNSKTEGVSIEGKVIDIQNDKLKLHLSIDGVQSIDDAYWYTFDTSYTAEASTGWYCMPQKGDSVMLYIPGMDERTAYVKRVNRTDGTENSKVQDPSVKYFGTIHGKQMKLAPKELNFDAVENVLFIKTADETGVEITSDNDINLKTGSFIYGECNTFKIESKDKIILGTGKANLIVDKIVHFKA